MRFHVPLLISMRSIVITLILTIGRLINAETSSPRACGAFVARLETRFPFPHRELEDKIAILPDVYTIIANIAPCTMMISATSKEHYAGP